MDPQDFLTSTVRPSASQVPINDMGEWAHLGFLIEAQEYKTTKPCANFMEHTIYFIILYEGDIRTCLRALTAG